MGMSDRLRNMIQQARGRGKEKTGRRTGNRRLEGEGKSDRYKGGAKQVGERAKGAAKDLRKTFRR